MQILRSLFSAVVVLLCLLVIHHGPAFGQPPESAPALKESPSPSPTPVPSPSPSPSSKRANVAAIEAGGKLYVGDDQEITVAIVPGNPFALYTDTLRVFSPISAFVGTNRSGGSKNIGKLATSAPNPTELILSLFADDPRNDNDFTYFTGPGFRNLDDEVHAFVNWIDGKTAEVGFEDVFEGGDNSNNDLTARVTGVTPGVDLQCTSFSYLVRGRRVSTNGPIPTNANLEATFTIKNAGFADSKWPFEISLYLSTDGNIDPKDDRKIGSVVIPDEIPAANEITVGRPEAPLIFNIQGTDLLKPLDPKYFGKLWIGVVIDERNELAEVDKKNNSNQTSIVDRRQFNLFDPIAPKTKVPTLSFPTSRAADRYLDANKFTYATAQGYTDTGYSRDTVDKVFSRFNGKTMPVRAFRIQAGVSESGPPYIIRFQGADATFNPDKLSPVIGEPNPNIKFSYGLSWFRYVWLYHDIF